MRLDLDDSSGDKSTTLFFVSISWLVVIFKFTFAGLTLPLLGEFPEMSGGEFAAAVTAVLGIWLGREWRKAHYTGSNNAE